jgi:hypothetical protein
VFGDYALARELQAYERRYVKEEYGDALDQIAAIRTRYDLTDPSELASMQELGTAVA